MGLENLIGSLKRKVMKGLKKNKAGVSEYDKIEKSDSMRVEIKSRKARKLIQNTLKVADSPPSSNTYSPYMFSPRQKYSGMLMKTGIDESQQDSSKDFHKLQIECMIKSLHSNRALGCSKKSLETKFSNLVLRFRSTDHKPLHNGKTEIEI
ncbi:hypothetical protein AgCh_016208 [Apium graveolens]